MNFQGPLRCYHYSNITCLMIIYNVYLYTTTSVVSTIQVIIRIIFQMSDRNIYYSLCMELAMIDLSTFVRVVALEPFLCFITHKIAYLRLLDIYHRPLTIFHIFSSICFDFPSSFKLRLEVLHVPLHLLAAG